MPAKSKAQQQLFAIVHGYQTGKIPANKVSSRIKKIAKSISPEEAKKYASTPHAQLYEVLMKVLSSPVYIEETLKEIVETRIPGNVGGHAVDQFTANMILTVSSKLTAENKYNLFQRPLHEVVAISYKLLTT